MSTLPTWEGGGEKKKKKRKKENKREERRGECDARVEVRRWTIGGARGAWRRGPVDDTRGEGGFKDERRREGGVDEEEKMEGVGFKLK